MSSKELADTCWRIHLFQRRAAASMESALRASEASIRRRLELERVQRELRSRREALARRRRELAAERLHARSPAITTPRCTGADLARALTMAGHSDVELWIAYFGLGGHLGLTDLREVLAGERPVGPLDHDLVATALNEWFDDAGFGRPVELWDEAVRSASR